ncbi:MAG: hypothetical protein Q4C14_00680 [Bacillota bacterium]|nr:hypothetical protein [Bacillota bacterium]
MLEMLRYSRKILVPVLVFVLALAVSGCGGNGNGSAGKDNTESQAGYFVENNINVEYLDEELKNGSGEYLEISGLKDKDIEKSINEKIYAKYTELKEKKELPPYRGIKQMVNEGEEPQSCYVSVSLSANINNILSLCLYRSCSFNREEGRELYLSEEETLNIDLNTGNEISLEEVFADGVDYRDYINRYVEMESFSGADAELWYSEGDSNLKLTAPFKGIDAGQKFLISEYDGNIQLIFDYNNPEVYCENWSPVTFTVKMNENSALPYRFYDEKKCIYEDENISFRLIERPFDVNEAVDVYESFPVGDSGASADIRGLYYRDMSEPAFKLTESLLKTDRDITDKYKSESERLAAEYSMDNVPGYASYYVNTNRYGQFTNIITGFYADIYVGDEAAYTENRSRYYCFRGEEEKPLELSDIFVKDSDIKEIMIDAFMENYRIYIDGDYGEEIEKDEKIMRSYFEEAWEKINGFAVDGTSLMLSYDSLRPVTEKYFGTENIWVYEMFCENAEYKHLRAENLNIFETAN